MAKSKRTRRRSTHRDAAPSAVLTSADRVHRRAELLKWLGTFLLLAAFAVIALIVINSDDDGDPDSGSARNPATIVSADALPDSIQQNGAVLGDPNAPILVIEYGDYQCPFCKRFAVNDMSRLVDEYVATGKIRMEFRQLPIIGSNSDGTFDEDGESFMAAEAAYCAADQGKFWPMHDLLFANSLGEFAGSFTLERLKRIAALVPDIDTGAFSACLDSHSHAQDVLNSGENARVDGVSSTPTFIVNGQVVRGADYERLRAAIDDQLAKQ